MKVYFYDNDVKKIKIKNSFVVEKYIVYEIETGSRRRLQAPAAPAAGGGRNIDIAERKVKTITSRLKRKLAGGYFTEKNKPYNFKTDYMIIPVLFSTRVRRLDKQDKFIVNLIRREGY